MNATTTCDTIFRFLPLLSTTKHNVFIGFLGSIAILNVLLNTAAIVAIVQTKQHKSIGMQLILWLSVSDLLSGLIVQPLLCLGMI